MIRPLISSIGTSAFCWEQDTRLSFGGPSFKVMPSLEISSLPSASSARRNPKRPVRMLLTSPKHSSTSEPTLCRSGQSRGSDREPETYPSIKKAVGHSLRSPFIHDFKHGISAISNHPVPLLSMKEHISRPWSEKQRWAVRRAHTPTTQFETVTFHMHKFRCGKEKDNQDSDCRYEPFAMSDLAQLRSRVARQLLQ